MEIREEKSSLGISYRGFLIENPNIVFVHGIFGSGRNWQNYLRFVAKEYNLPALALDQRGHGQSDFFSSPATLQTLADDLIHFLKEKVKTPALLIGHSLGARVVMKVAAQSPDLIRSLMIVDSNLEPIPTQRLSPLDWMKSVPTPIKNRSAARDQLKTFSTDPMIVNFLLTNLIEKENGWEWRIDLNGLTELRENLAQVSLEQDWAKISSPIHLVRGEKSEHLTALQAKEMIASARDIKFYEIPEAGHWCHAENPAEFQKALREFLDGASLL